MKKQRKDIIRNAAIIYAANVVKNAMGNGASSDLINEDELALLHKQMCKISKSICDINAGTLDECISIAINHSTPTP